MLINLRIMLLIFALVANEQSNAINFNESQSETHGVGENKGIPNFPDLKNNEKREIFLYEQTIVVRDSEVDGELRRCEVFEVYENGESEGVLSVLKKLLNRDKKVVEMDKMMNLLKDCESVDGDIEQESEPQSEPEETTSNTNSTGESAIKNGILPENVISPQATAIVQPKGIGIMYYNRYYFTSGKIIYCHYSIAGTKWCGPGDIAESYNDLGKFRDTDKCCRTHDLCPIKLKSGDEKYNLKNDGLLSTKSHCRCDEVLYNCLKKENGVAAKIVGNVLFMNSVTKPDCITGVPEKSEEEMKLVQNNLKW